jgi:hypothetical protein
MKELKYELDDNDPYATVSLTTCPYYLYKTIGSIRCIVCRYHQSRDKGNMIVCCIKDEQKEVKK